MIGRDGNTTSLWQDSVGAYSQKQKTALPEAYDVIIVGGGITGVSTAFNLQHAGFKCLLVEARNLCFGTTGGTTAHLNTLLDIPYTTIENNFSKEKARQTADAVKEAIAFIESNVKELNIACGFRRTEACLFAREADQVSELEEIYDATTRAGVEAHFTDAFPLTIPYEKAMRVPGQACFHPLPYVYALAEAFEKMGGVILQQCRVKEVQGEETLEVDTDCGKFTCKKLVYATHTPPGINLLHTRLIPYRSYALAAILEDDAYPAELCYDMYDPYHYYRTQEVNGKNYFIVGGYDHKTGKEANTLSCHRELEAHLRSFFHVKEVVYEWSSQYFESIDGLPYIGALPGKENIYVACGYGGNGMVYSSVAAITLKEIFLGKESLKAALFQPSRFKPVAGFSGFVSLNAGTAGNFIKKILPAEKMKEWSDLAMDEARLVQHGGEKIALYKDENGNLHALHPECEHMKCEVRWNTSEKSWDCPCHGARYHFDGNVITGPANGNLTTYELWEKEKSENEE